VPFNPFGLTIGEDAADFLRTGDIVGDYAVDEDIVNIALTGDLYELPAGPLGIAAGVEWRELSSERNPDDSFIDGSVLGLIAQGAVAGSTDVAEVFIEALVPLVADAPFAEYLGLEAGYRYSDYRFGGVADNWKAGVDWSPGAGVRLRAMAQRAIRAPNIDELFRQAAVQQTSLLDGDGDFCSAGADPVGRGLTDLCVAQGIPTDQVGIYQAQDNFPLTNFDGGGNTDLEAETADTFTAGVVYQPEWGAGLSMSLDYYRIEIDNAIGSTGLEDALELCARSNDPASSFCAPVVRGPSGDITEYTNPQFNLAKLAVEGIDLALNHSFDLGEGLALPGHSARLALQVLLNYAIENVSQATVTNPELDCAGLYGGACAFANRRIVPEYRSSTRLTYYTGPLSVALNWRWIGGLENGLDSTCDDFPESCYPSELGDVDSRNYLELSGRFEFGERAEVFGGVSNLTEEDPPLLGFGAIQSNTAPSLYDVFGRRYFLGLRFRL
jgi:outer membrane receptor protein involved in Fe transport